VLAVLAVRGLRERSCADVQLCVRAHEISEFLFINVPKCGSMLTPNQLDEEKRDDKEKKADEAASAVARVWRLPS
jgi:hypothetical protein